MRIDENKDTEITETNQGPSIGVDVDYYQDLIDDPHVCEARKRELIAIIGTIVVQFIDLGFGVHPVRLARADKANGADKPNARTVQTNTKRSESQKGILYDPQ